MTTLKEVRLHCPVCEREFPSRRVVSTNVFGGKRTDFQPRAAGTQPTPYFIHVCPKCGYAGTMDAFSTETAPAASVVEHVWNDIAPRMTGSCLAGSDKFDLAARVAIWSDSSLLIVADLYLQAAWCCVDEGDVEAERYYRRLAAWSFERALTEYDLVEPSDRAVLTYLVGELWRRIGNERLAREWFDRVEDEIVDEATQRWLVDIAMQQRDNPRDWFTGEVHRATSSRH